MWRRTDIGIGVSYARHHKHSLALIAQPSPSASSPSEILLTANVARYHRRSVPALRHSAYAALNPMDRRRVVRLGALLRLADVLDREHRQAIRRLRAGLLKDWLCLDLGGEGVKLPEKVVVRGKADRFA